MSDVAKPTADQGKLQSPDVPAPAKHLVGVPSAISADLMRPVPVLFNGLILGLACLVFGFIAWASLAVIEEATRGEGRVIPASKIQLVQNLEGGIVRELNVREGDRVEVGDVLLRIDPTRATASHGEAQERIAGLRALMARLQAETEGRALAFPDDLKATYPELLARQREHFVSRKAELTSAVQGYELQARQRAQELIELDAKIKTLTRGLEIARAEWDILKPLAKSRSVSKSELLRAEGKVNDTEGALEAAKLALPRVRAQKAEVQQRIAEREATFRSETLSQLTKARVELSALTESNREAADALARTTVRAPATGIVKTVHVTTIGQVVKPGSDLIEIVPLNEKLLVEAKVSPRDIAFLRPGQRALVKLTAYDFSIYGGLEGRVENIGADSVTNDKGETFYMILVRTDSSRLQHGDDSLPIIPGMVAQVDVMTGSKTVLAYMTKPLTRMRQDALRER